MARYRMGDFTEVGIFTMADSTKFTPKVKRLGKDDMSRVKLGIALAQEGRFGEATSELESALQENPSSFRTHIALGTIKFKQKKYDEALEHFKEAMRLDPLKPQAPLKVAKLHLRQGNIDKALRHFQTTINLDPKAVQAYVGIGQAYMQQGKYAEAEQHLRRALRLDPGLLPARQRLAQVYVKQGKLAEAIAELESALGNSAKSAGTYSRLGRVYLEQKEYTAAAAALHKAVELNPEVRVAIRFEWIEALIGSGELEAASEALATLPQSKRAAPRVHKLRGDIYTQQGLFKEATEEYQAATLLAKDADDALDELEDLDLLEEEGIDWEEMANTYRTSATTLMSERRRPTEGEDG